MEKFKKLGLSEGLLEAVRKQGFTEPSEIQEKSVPLVLSGKDVIARSATGSGKTLAFGAGIVDNVIPREGIQALILTPTRELADQVARHLRMFSNGKLAIMCVYGGVSMGPQIYDLRRADVVVGTPGRILDHLGRKTLNLSRVKILVLDEADRMADMGFIKDVEKIVNFCPRERQTLLFSATLSRDIEYLSRKYMKNPIRISAGEQVDPSKLYQTYYDISSEMKFSLLVHLLKLEKNGVVMVFCNTRRNTDKVTENLQRQGIEAMAIHGGLSQNRRDSTLRAFRSRDTLVLVCTDIAARGLDIKDVSHVYNFDIPKVSSDYVHRIGRTARAGKNGIAITFVSPGEHGGFRQILRDTGAKVEKLIVPENMAVIFSAGFKPRSNEGRLPRGRGRRFVGHREKSRRGNERMRELRMSRGSGGFVRNNRQNRRSRRR